MSQVQWDANAYESVASPQLGWGRKLLDSRNWRGDETVLDAGCGPGTLALEIAKRVPNGRVVAVDNDTAMVRRTREKIGADARITVQEQDLAHLSLQETFDVVFSNAVLHWLDDHDAVFASFLHHLKPGGEILVQGGGEGNLDRIRGIASQVVHSDAFAASFKDWTPPWHYEDDASTQERLLIAGFVHTKVSLESTPTAFPDAKTFRAFAEAVVLLPFLQRLQDADRRRAFVDEFMQRVGNEPKDLVFDYVRLNVRAERSPHH